jgi:hypothetical protein
VHDLRRVLPRPVPAPPRRPDLRWLHLLGVLAAAGYAAFVIWLGWWWLLVILPVPAYALGWLGHLLAHNHPTFFTHHFYSFLGSWKILAGVLRGGGSPE